MSVKYQGTTFDVTGALSVMGDASRRASDSIANVGSTLERVIQKQEDASKARFAKAGVDNNNAYQSLLSSIETAEELVARSGELSAMRDSFGGNMDPALAREGIRNQLNTLRTRAATEVAHKNAQRAEIEGPIGEAYRVAVLNKDEKTQAAIRAANPGLKNWSTLLAEEQKTEQGFADRDRSLFERDRADKTYQRTEDAAVVAETKLRETTSLEKAHSASVQKHREKQTIYGQTLTNMAKAQGFDLPVDGQGRVQLDLLTEPQYTKLKTMSGNQPGNILQAYEQGDTKVADTFMKDAAASGQYSPSLLEQTRSTLRSAYNTDNNEEKVGRDKANVEKFNAKQTVQDNETRRVNPHVPGSESAMNMFKRVDEQLPLMLDQSSGLGAEEDLPRMRTEMYKMVTEGVKIGDQVLTPSEEILRLAAGNAQGGWFRDATRGNNFRTEVIKLMNEKGMLELYKKAEGVHMRDRTRAVETTLKDARKTVSK